MGINWIMTAEVRHKPYSLLAAPEKSLPAPIDAGEIATKHAGLGAVSELMAKQV